MEIIKIDNNSKYFDSLINLELLLWPNHEYNDFYIETKESKDNFFGAIINNTLIGFIQVSIRYEYINGTETSPVGYIEGIYVIDSYRNKGIGRSLVDFAFDFIKKSGCSEIASDVEIDNFESQKFHLKMGFKETKRVIYYNKKLIDN